MISLQKEMQKEFRGYWTEAVKPTVKIVDRASTRFLKKQDEGQFG